jgi:cysteine desulfurase/selenocysteine lyase
MGTLARIRRIMLTAVTGAIAASAIGSGASKAQTMPAILSEALKPLFPMTSKKTYLNTALRSAQATFTEDALREWSADLFNNNGNVAFSSRVVEEARASVATLLHTSQDQIAFIQNTTDGLNVILHSLALKSGDVLIVPDFEFPGLYGCLKALESRGVTSRRVPIRDDGSFDYAKLDELTQTSPRAFLFSLVSYITGYRANLKTISELCQSRGVVTICDAMQAIGLIDLKADELGIDAIASGSYKGLLGLPGTGVLWVRKGFAEEFAPAYGGDGSFDTAPDGSFASFKRSARRYEFGNANYVGIFVLRRSVDFLLATGVHTIEQHIRELTTNFRGIATAAGWNPVPPEEWSRRSHIVPLNLGHRSTDVATKLAAENILVTQHGPRLRVSFGLYNTDKDIERIVSVLRSA